MSASVALAARSGHTCGVRTVGAADPDLERARDEDLVRKARIGDRRAFGELIDRHGAALFRYVRRLLHDDGAIDDVVQDALVAAWRGLDRYRGESSFRTWLFALASHKAIDHRRARVPVPVDEAAFESDVARGPAPEQRAEQTAFLAALESALAQLPYHQRACWWLREVEGMSHEEIAHVLLIGRGSVRGNLQRARTGLARIMAPWQ